MSTPAIWCRVVQSRDVSPHNFDGLAMSSSAFTVAPTDRSPGAKAISQTHTKPLLGLRQLHWQPTQHRIMYKLAVGGLLSILTYKVQIDHIDILLRQILRK